MAERVTLEVSVDPEKWIITTDGPDWEGVNVDEDVAQHVASAAATAEHLRGAAAHVRLVGYDPTEG